MTGETSRRRYLAGLGSLASLGALAGCQRVRDALGDDGTRAAQWLPSKDAFTDAVGLRYEVTPFAKLRAQHDSIDDDVFVNLYNRPFRHVPLSATDGTVQFQVGQTRGRLVVGSFDRTQLERLVESDFPSRAEEEGTDGDETLYRWRTEDGDDSVQWVLGDGLLLRAEGQSGIAVTAVLERFVDAVDGTDRMVGADSDLAGTLDDPGIGHRFRLTVPSERGDYGGNHVSSRVGERYSVRQFVAEGETVIQTMRFVFPADETVPASDVRSLVTSEEDYDNPFGAFPEVEVTTDGQTVTATASAENPWPDDGR